MELGHTPSCIAEITLCAHTLTYLPTGISKTGVAVAFDIVSFPMKVTLVDLEDGKTSSYRVNIAGYLALTTEPNMAGLFPAEGHHIFMCCK